MRKPLLLLVACCYLVPALCQKTGSIILRYRTDKFTLSESDKLKLDSFLLNGWDQILIKGFTDEVDDSEYNIELSKKRSMEVYQYCTAMNLGKATLTIQYFGEAMPVADNISEQGKAANRRTEIIGYQFRKVCVPCNPDPMKPVTSTLDNGFIITYKPGQLPEDLASSFGSGSGNYFRTINNTTEMLQNNMFDNTTNGEILSSVTILCNSGISPCKLAEPIELKVPIPYKTKCPIEKVKFYKAVEVNGKRIWQEESRLIYPIEINGRQYIKLSIDDFCSCINFDFKVPECFEVDSAQIRYTNADIRNLSSELSGLNSIYLPRKISDSICSILYLKGQLGTGMISFSLYNGKRRIRSFKNEQLSSFPCDEENGCYLLKSSTCRISFPRLEAWDVVLNVNKERYRVIPNDGIYEFKYLDRSNEKILVDFTISESKRKMQQYVRIPIESLPYDAIKGCYLLDKKFLKTLKLSGALANK